MSDLWDWAHGVVIQPVGSLTVPAQDFTDWTDGYVDITVTVTPTEDFPDWTKVLAQVSVPIRKPTDLTGLVFWLDATQVSQGDGTALTTWSDLSGNANNFVVDGAPNPPTLYTTTTGQLINGKAAVRFTAALHTALSAAALVTAGTPYTLCHVSRFASTGQTAYFYHQQAAGNDVDWLVNTGNYELANNAALNLTDGAADTTAHSYIVLPAATANVIMDGTSIMSGNSQAPGTGAGTIVLGAFEATGNSFPLDGWHGEMFLYNRALNSSEQSQVTDYLRGKWSTP